MKHTLLSAILVFAFVTPALAKNGILMGKVTGPKGKAVNVSEIIVAGNGVRAAASLKNGGLYYSDMIPEGQYDVSFVINGVSYKTNITFTGNDGSNSTKPIFYNFVLDGGKLSQAMSDEDPFAANVLNAVKEEPALFDFGGARNHGTVVLPFDATSAPTDNFRRRFYISRAIEKVDASSNRLDNHATPQSAIDKMLSSSSKLKYAPLHIIKTERLFEGPDILLSPRLKYCPLHIISNEPLLEGSELKKQ